MLKNTTKHLRYVSVQMPLHIQQHQPQPIVSVRFVCGTYFLHCYPHTLIRKAKNSERALSSRFFYEWMPVPAVYMRIYIYIYVLQLKGN